jgi:hypothetical protein
MTTATAFKRHGRPRPTAADRARHQHAAAVRTVAIASPAEGSGTTMRLRPPLSLAFVK